MVNVLMILNQIQAGIGGEEKANIPPGGKKGPLGPGVMMTPHLKATGSEIIATLYCGDQYFLDHKEEVTRQMIAMTKKLNPDVVVCGPALSYPKFGEMAGYIAKAISNHLAIPAFAAMAVENEAVEKYKKDIYIIKTPKKGGIGLTDSLKHICYFAVKLANKEVILSAAEEGYFERD